MRAPFEPVHVLVLGCGYVAQHLIEAMRGDSRYKITYSHRRAEAPWPPMEGVSSVALELTDMESVAAALWATLPDVIVNCAAMSSPAACEREPAACEAVNCPVGLMECMYASVPDALFVHFSTDIVHAGCETAGAEPYGDAGAGGVDKARRVAEAARPLNAYGRSKLAFERALCAGPWPRCAILRCSNIVGGPAPYTREGKFAQFVAAELAKSQTSGEPVRLWKDEVRCFVDVRQITAGVLKLVDRHARAYAPPRSAAQCASLVEAAKSPSETALFEEKARREYPPVFLLLNCGGPEPLSRADLGRTLAEVLNMDASLVSAVSRAASQLSSPSPLVVCLDSSSFAEHTGLALTPLRDALRYALLE